jgi:hypothetical protein
MPLRALLIALLLCALAPAADARVPPGAETQAPPGADTTPPPGDVLEGELILTLNLGRYVLSDGIVAYARPQGVLLPLGALTRALDFPIAVDPKAGTAEGWFLTEERRFSLATAKGEVTVEGRTEALPAGAIEVQPDDIYVESGLIGTWFPIEIRVDLSELSAELEAREPLPFQAALERERLRAILLN